MTEAELKTGTAQVFTYGLRRLWSDYHQKSGLTYRAIAGCIINDYIKGMADGNRKAIEDYIKAHGYPSNSRKNWEKIILDPASYQSTLSEEKLVKFGKGVTAVELADGEYRLEIRQAKTAGKRTKEFELLVSNKAGFTRNIYHINPDSQHTAFFGPEGSRLLFIEVNYQDVKSVWYVIGLPDLAMLNRIGGE